MILAAGPKSLKRVSGEEWNPAIFNVNLRNARDEIDPAPGPAGLVWLKWLKTHGADHQIRPRGTECKKLKHCEAMKSHEIP